MLNVYQKLNKARGIFHESEIKKTGRNAFAGYSYFELSDFVVPALRIFSEVGLTPVIRFGAEEAVMDIINSDKPDEKISITSPMSEAALKGCHPVQNLGAVESYIRRYLWTAALELIEHDAIDRSEPVTHTQEKKEVKEEVKEDKTKGGLNDDQKLLISVLKDFALNMGSEKELKDLWGENISKLDEIEAADKAAHDDLKEHFRKARAKLKEKK